MVKDPIAQSQWEADPSPPNGIPKGEIGKSGVITGKEHHQSEGAVPGTDPALKVWGGTAGQTCHLYFLKKQKGS